MMSRGPGGHGGAHRVRGPIALGEIPPAAAFFYNAGMDACLLEDARRDAAAVAISSGRVATAGVVIGHKRGHRFVAERLVPAGAASRFTGEVARKLDALYEGRVIGVFAEALPGALGKRLLGPAFYGRLVLSLGPGPAGADGGPGIEAWIVEFDGRFHLEPVPIVTLGKGGRP